MRQGVGEDAQEGGVLFCLAVYPLQGILMYEVAGVLAAVLEVAVASSHGLVLYVLLQHIHHHMLVAILLGVVAVEEVGIVGVCLELADVAIVAVYATLVGQGCTAALSALGSVGVAVGIKEICIGVVGIVVTACPLAEHAGVVAGLLHHLGYYLMVHQVGFLANEAIVGIIAVHIGPGRGAPILPVATHMGVTSVLAGHERGTRRGTHRAASICLGEAHALLCHAVQVGGLYSLLAIAAKVAITHIITHDEDNVGTLCLCAVLAIRNNLC